MIRELIPPGTGSAFRAMRALRPSLDDEDSFVRAVDEMQRPEGYRLVGVFEEGGSEAVAVAGFRTCHSIAWGHYLYVDDLSTLPEAGANSFTSTPGSASTAPMPIGST